MAIKGVWPGTALSVQITGDEKLGIQLVRQARIVAGNLFGSLRPGQTFRQGWWHGENGAAIKVSVWRTAQGEKALAQIWAAGGGKEFIELYLEHGFIKGPDLVQISDELLGLQDTVGVIFAPITLSSYSATLSNKLPDFLANNWYKVRPEPTEKNKKKFTVVAREDLPYHAVTNNPELTFRDDLSRPHAYSGLMQLLTQAKLGIGVPFRTFYEEHIAKIFPFYTGDVPLRNTCIGCIRSPTDELWLVIFWNLKTIYGTVNNGVFAVKLEYDNRLSAIRQIATSEEYTTRIRDMAESWSMAYSTVNAGSFKQLLSAYDLEYIKLAEMGDLSTCRWGLSWRFQHRGAADEYIAGACAVTTFGTHEVSFEWDNQGVPSILLTSVPVASYTLNSHNVLYRHQQTLALWYWHQGSKNVLEEVNDGEYYSYLLNNNPIFTGTHPFNTENEVLEDINEEGLTNTGTIRDASPYRTELFDVTRNYANVTRVTTPDSLSYTLNDTVGTFFCSCLSGLKNTATHRWASIEEHTLGPIHNDMGTEAAFIYSDNGYASPYPRIYWRGSLPRYTLGPINENTSEKRTSDEYIFYDGSQKNLMDEPLPIGDFPATVPPWSCTDQVVAKWLYTSYAGEMATELFPGRNPNGYTLDNRNCFVGGG